MLLLHDKDQQWNNPLASFATYTCRQRRRTWVNCKLRTAWPQKSDPGSYATWVSYWQINCYCKK